jgi:SAM-dependent methyltransferase
MGQDDTNGSAAVGSASRWGPLWGSRPDDWAALEEQQVRTYEQALARVEVGPGSRVLDIGCGSGVFLRLATDLGADVAGLDASGDLLEVALRRVPGADLRTGEMEALPWDAHSFDLVCGFNSFFFAADLVGALREAARVAKRGAPVIVQVWGPPERCDLEGVKGVARRFAPPPPRDTPPPQELWREGVLTELVSEAGLAPTETFATSWPYEFPDEQTLGRQLMAPMGLASLVGAEREPLVRKEIVEAMRPFQRDDGSFSIENEFRFLLAYA